jgi:2-hydroxycyclohexanecarboxyl-CoA dehydrogenase
MTELDEWRGRKVLVTGGTSGTGLETARTLVAGGASVMVVGRDPGRAEAALKELQSLAATTGGSAHLALGDCGDYDQAARVVAEAVAGLGALDVLVSAGATGEGDPKPFADMTPAEILSGMTSRFLARVHPVHAAIPHLRGREGAAVVLLTTDAGRHATRGESIIGAYAASIIAVTKTLARELGRDRVRVNAVSMTLTSGTLSWESIFGEDSYQKDLFGKALDRFPFGAAPSARDVSEAVVFLASRRSAHVTGQTLSVNGGLSFGGW